MFEEAGVVGLSLSAYCILAVSEEDLWSDSLMKHPFEV